MRTELWYAAVSTFGVGDAATTAAGISVGAVEAHPASEAVLGAAGVVGMVAVKVAVICLLYAAYRAAPEDINVGVPLGLVLIGSTIVGWNAAVIAAVIL